MLVKIKGNNAYRTLSKVPGWPCALSKSVPTCASHTQVLGCEQQSSQLFVTKANPIPSRCLTAHLPGSGPTGRPRVPHSTLFPGAKENSRGAMIWTRREERPLRGPDELGSLRASDTSGLPRQGKTRGGVFTNRGQKSKLEHHRHCFMASKS